MSGEMSNARGARERNKAETRQRISDIATRLFIERGFENVSVAEIADAAAVTRKTVFNYFPRKEDLVFDREDEGRALVRAAIAARGARSPVRAFADAMRALLDTRHRVFAMSQRPVRFWKAVGESPTLAARARELQVTLADDLASELAAAVGRPAQDAEARLAATMLVSTLVVAYAEALRTFRAKRDADGAFVAIMERGFAGVEAALAGTPYV
jgi:AcrR family transcriptional regulator